jgi:hypothetical protein
MVDQKGQAMAKRNCKRCGTALTEGAKFCTSCGASAPPPETSTAFAPETRPLPREQADPNIQQVPGRPSGRQEIRQTAIVLPGYDTEELSRPETAPPVEKRAATTETQAPVTSPQVQTTKAQRRSGRGRGVALFAALGVIVLAVGAYFLMRPRESSQSQSPDQLSDAAKPAASSQPTAQPTAPLTVAVAKEPTPPQPASILSEVKPTSKQAGDTESKSQPPREETKSVSQEAPAQKAADGTGAALHNLNQGIEYMSGGKYQEALQEFEYVRKLDPDNKSVYYLIGQTYHKMNQLERALDAYRQCTAGVYASVAQSNVKMLEKKLGKTN